MTTGTDISPPEFNRRAVLKFSVSAAAIFAVFGTIAVRSAQGTWVLRQDDT